MIEFVSWIKSQKRLLLNIFLVFFMAPAVVAYAIYSLDQNGFFLIQKIELRINSKSDQKSYIKVYAEKLDEQLNVFKGQSLWAFELKNVSEILKKQKWIKEFHISRSWPASLEIVIDSQDVALLLVDSQKLSQGILRPVTPDGELLPEIDTRQTPARAFLKGEVFVRDLDKRKKAVELLKSLPAEGKIGVDQLADINYNAKDGYWVSIIHSDMKIKLGEDQFEVKTARVSQVMDYLEKRNLKARVIDANLSKKVLVRLQQNP